MSIGRHTTYNLVGGVVPLVVALLTVPLYLKLIGPERYGVLALAWLLLGYFGLFDLGLSRATSQRIASRRDSSSLTFWSALLVNAAMGILGAVVLYFVADQVFTRYLKVAADLRPEIAASVPWLAATLPIATIIGVMSGALIGRERFLETNLISTISTILTQLAPLAVAWLINVHMSGLIASVLAARLLALLLLWLQCRRHVTFGASPRVTKAEVLALLGFGGWVTISALVGPLMIVLDRFVIGALLGAVAVATYTVPWQLAQRLQLLPGALQLALFPRQAAATPEEQTRLTLAGIQAVGAVTTPLVVIGIFLMDPFLKAWIGGNFHVEAAEVGRIALLGFWINGMAFVPFAQVQARGHARTAALVHLLELPLYLATLFLLMRQFGLAGAAAAFTLRCAVDAIVFNWVGLAHNATWKGPLVLTGILTGSLVAADSFDSLGWSWFLAFASTLLVASALSYAFAPDLLKSHLGRLFSRLSLRPSTR